MFIKHGEGQIVNIVKSDDLTEDQKKLASKLNKSDVSTEEEESSDKSRRD